MTAKPIDQRSPDALRVATANALIATSTSAEGQSPARSAGKMSILNRDYSSLWGVQLTAVKETEDRQNITAYFAFSVCLASVFTSTVWVGSRG